jgi:hypothetical protein
LTSVGAIFGKMDRATAALHAGFERTDVCFEIGECLVFDFARLLAQQPRLWQNRKRDLVALPERCAEIR